MIMLDIIKESNTIVMVCALVRPYSARAGEVLK